MNDLDKLLGGMAADPTGTQPPVTDPADPVNPVDPVTPDPASDPAGDPSPNQDNQTIRQMREEIARNKQEAAQANKLMEKIAKSNNMSVEEYIKKLEEDEVVEKAKVNNISPEIQKIIDNQNAQIAAIQKDKERALFNKNMNELIATQKINEEQAAEFLRNANERGVDVINSPLTHSELYMALNGKTIIENLRNDIRQEVLAEIQNQGSLAPTPGTGGTPPATGGSLEDFLKDYKEKN